MKRIILACLLANAFNVFAQKPDAVTVQKVAGNRIDVMIGKKPFTSFLYPDTLEKPVLYPVFAVNGIDVTRGFPMNPKSGDPTDHPHHIGIWFNYENLNGLDFWNNSYAIPKDKKHLYGWIKTDKILEIKGGSKGLIKYHANWLNQGNKVLVEETTSMEFSQLGNKRFIDRITTLKANTEAKFADAKDGMFAIRLAHELQMPSTQDQKFTDDKGNVTVIKAGNDKVPTGNYINSSGKAGDNVWSSRGNWCKVYGKMGNDSVAITIIDHPKNPNYPTFWHARGYGLFAANPLGEKIFTNGKSEFKLTLQKGQSITFRYRVVVENGKATSTFKDAEKMAVEFAGKKDY